MARIQTPINGITTTSAYVEGDCYSLVNLRPKNGALHPVAPRKIMQDLSQKYDIVFVHQNNDYKNWIGVINDENYATIYWDILNEQPKTIESYIPNKIHSVQQIGNTLSFITSDNIYYAWYTNNDYTFLGELPEVPAIRLKTSDEMSHIKYHYESEYGEATVPKENFIEATKGLVNKAMDLLVNGGVINGESFDGYGMQLFDACFIRYAFRLYDGTLTKHSPPILVMPVKDILTTKTTTYYFFGGKLKKGFVDVYGYRILMEYDFSKFGNEGYGKWTDIIKSVDIFMSQPLGISSIENIRKDMLTSDNYSPIGDPKPRQYNLIKAVTPEALKNVSNTSTFYLVRSINIGEKTEWDPDPLPSKESDFGKMENLIFQEVMSDDNFSHHKYGAETSYTYNNRLHLGGIKTTFFKGFSPDYFLWFNTADVDYGNYNGYKYKDAPDPKFNRLIIETEINVGSSLEKVYSVASSYLVQNIYKMFMSAFISYPDSRAKRMTIYHVDNSNKWHKLFSQPLEKHNLLNLSFFVSEGLKPIVGYVNPQLLNTAPDTSRVISLTEQKIKVSELNNPLVFPNANTYQVGNGMILAMASNAMLASDRNKGQFPLYVFTTHGVWNLNVGQGEVVYSTLSDPTSTEAPINSIVESTPFGVVYVSARGLMMISGQNVNFISPQIEQPYKKIEQETNTRIEELLHTFEKQTFSDYLKTLSGLIYDPYENELIVYNKETGFNYVLSFYTQSFYQSTETIDSVVKNTFPELYVIGDNKLKHYSEIETKQTHVSFMLRPLTYGNESTKWLQNVKIPFTLYDIEKMFVGIYASSDNVKFPGRFGKFYEAMNRAVSYDTKTMASNTARYFLLSFAAILSDDSYLDIIDSEVITKYNNM